MIRRLLCRILTGHRWHPAIVRLPVSGLPAFGDRCIHCGAVRPQRKGT